MSGVGPSNREIYETRYQPAQLELRPETPYDATMIRLRLEALHRYGAGRDVIDLCCGTGSYLLAGAPEAASIVGYDFSRSMLAEVADRSGGRPENAWVVQADARALPSRAEVADLVVSFTSLYYVPDVGEAIREVARVLRPGGVAVLELGNRHSLNTVVARVNHEDGGWALPVHVPYRRLRAMVAAARLEVEQWRCFQLLPMYGAPRRLRWLAPLLTARWKRVLGRQWRGRMLDEIVSSAPGVRHLAFRHVVVVRKR